MTPPTILTVFGTRPEAIKMFPVVQALQAESGLDTRVAVTAQHREMLDQVLDIAGIVPDIDLDLMTAGQSLDELSARILTNFGAALDELKPARILVHGDTLTTMMATIAAYFRKIPVGHVEAGLRSGNIYSPWPEEVNRKVTGAIADLHFAPTEAAAASLKAENVPASAIHVTGNTVIDALLQSVREDYRFDDPQLAALSRDSRIMLVTMHRRESIGEPMRQVANAILRIKNAHPDLTVVLPTHRNPAVREIVMGALADTPGIILTDPLPYLDFVHMMARSHLILTDSGGVQEEAPSLKKPVLVIREVTERPEGVTAGVAKLVGTNAEKIFTAVHQLLTDAQAYNAMIGNESPYGDGQASVRIADAIVAWHDRISKGGQ